jgi:hypothetical protein
MNEEVFRDQSRFFLFIKRIRFISLLSSLLIEDYFEFKLKKNYFVGKILSDYDFIFFRT